jgi:aspartyl-tRNA synthetase
MKDAQRTLVVDTTKHVDEDVVLKGWVATKRDHGKLTFIDLRDRTGIIQCVGVGKMGELTTESVVELHGKVQKRPERMVNPNIATGTVELFVNDYIIIKKAEELPIQIDTAGHEIGEEVRLKYRYLDLRRERMQKVIRMRSKYTNALRSEFLAKDFVEIETPMLIKSTMEGARDFLVPSRFQPGKFYALPQSPQQYKQLLMTAGFERYFQFAHCLRDEDLRADRGFEHTQVDLEMSFVNRDEVMQTVEDVVKKAVAAVGGKLKDDTFPVISYADAMKNYGADKFDLRTEKEKEENVLAFAWVVNFPFFKKVDPKDAAEKRDSKSGWTFTHNPFSMPIPEHVDWLLEGKNIDQIVTTQYDLVCNGFEAGGGSIRAHRPDLLKATYKIMGYTEKETQESVGHMLEAFSYGTPPHGGIALGLDRLVMLLSGETSLKEAIAFPMTSTGRTAVMDAPSAVSEAQLKELGLSVSKKK